MLVPVMDGALERGGGADLAVSVEKDRKWLMQACRIESLLIICIGVGDGLFVRIDLG